MTATVLATATEEMATAAMVKKMTINRMTISRMTIASRMVFSRTMTNKTPMTDSDDPDDNRTPPAACDGDNNNDDDQYYDEVNPSSFSDPDDLVDLDDDAAPSSRRFSQRQRRGFSREDDGTWTETDYQESAKNLYGDHQYFGDTQATQLASQGYQQFADPGFMGGMNQLVPGSADTLNLYERDGRLHAFGFIEAAALSLIISSLHRGRFQQRRFVSVPQRGDITPPQPLPPAFAAVEPKDAVDLRKFATPIGDQGQTSRCSAFAWTHATELVTNMKTGGAPRLSPALHDARISAHAGRRKGL